MKPTAVGSLRFFIGLPAVQQHLLTILLEDSYDSMVEAIINALRDGHEYNRDMVMNWELIDTWWRLPLALTIGIYLQIELKHLLKVIGTPASLPLSNVIENRSSHHRRNTNDWDSTAPSYDVIAPASERAADVINYPYHRGFLWSKTLGKATGEHQIFIQATTGLFAGANFD